MRCLWPYETLKTEKVAGQQSYFPTRYFRDTTLTYTLTDTITQEVRTFKQVHKRANLERYLKKYESHPRYKLASTQLARQRINVEPDVKVDSFKLFDWYPRELKSFRAPILYNRYSGTEIYRFYCSRALRTPVLIQLEHNQKGSWIVTKMREFGPYTYQKVKTSTGIRRVARPLQTRKKYKINQRNRITEEAYEQFIALLDSTHILCTPSLQTPEGYIMGDGKNYTLEIHRPEGYRFYTRHSPNYTDRSPYLRKVCDYLVKLSALDGGI